MSQTAIKTKLRAFPIVRVSHKGSREPERFIAPTEQRRELAAWETRHDITIDWDLLTEEIDVSGADRERAVIARAIKLIEDGEIHGIVGARFDRLSRDAWLSEHLMERVRAVGGYLWSAEQNYDLDTVDGRQMFRITGAIDQGQRERLREGLARAYEQAVIEKRIHPSGQVPVGYVKNPQTRILVLDPDVAPAVERAFRIRAEGGRLVDAAAPLEKATGHPWAPAAVSHVLRNRVYLGEARYGQHVNREAHDPIVSRKLFEQVQTLRQPGHQRGNRNDLLTGIIRCAGCRYAMTPGTSGSGKRMYVCSSRCEHAASVTAELVEAEVERIFLDEMLAPGEADVEEIPVGVRLGGLQAEVDQLLADETDWSENPEPGLDRDAYRRGLSARIARREAKQAELKVALAESEVELIAEDLNLLRDWSEESVAERRKVLARALDVVFVRSAGGRRGVPIGERLIVLWRGQAPPDLPRRGRRRFTPEPY